MLEVHALGPWVERLNEFDRIAADPEIWLEAEELILLRNVGGKTVIGFEGQDMIAAGYYLPAAAIADEFSELDPDFKPEFSEVYIYSVVVHPAYRRRGIGNLIRKELCRQALLEGYETGSAHVRHKRDWASAGMKFYQPTEHRRIEGYWEGSDSPDVEFMRFNLADVA